MNPLTPEEQAEIAGLNPLQQDIFTDYILENHTGGPDYYDGWTKYEFCMALFAGADAWRAALQFTKQQTRKQTEHGKH